MPTVELEEAEWNTVMAMIAGAPWRDANPLLLKIGEQLRRSQAANAVGAANMPPQQARKGPVPAG